MFAYRSPKLTTVARAAWLMAGRSRLSLTRIFAKVILPLSLLPPLMLYYAGTYHGDAFMSGFSARDWRSIAIVFFLAELATVGAMGPAIRGIARLNGVSTDRESSCLLAFAAPIPLWLSSLALFVPNFFVAATAGVLALAFSCVIIYHGVSTLLRIRDDIVAGSIAYGIMACGMVAWAMLLVIVIPLG